MKGLLLAGGHGTRLRPLTYTGNKHMLPVANKPILFYGLNHLKNAGINEVGIVLGPVKEGIEEAIGDGSKFGVKVTYLNQIEPKGIAHAVKIAEDFVKDEPVVVYLGDNLLKDGIEQFVKEFQKENWDELLLLSKIDEIAKRKRFGVAHVKNNKVIKAIENPERPEELASDLVMIGVYMFRSKIFEAINSLKPSVRNELEITDAIQKLIDWDCKVVPRVTKGWWKDTGTPEDILEANRLVLDELKPEIKTKIEDKNCLQGRVTIEENVTVKQGSSIRGPTIIGKGVTIEGNVFIGPFTSIGNNVTIKRGAIENSIIMDDCLIDVDERITDSIVASHSKIVSSENKKPRGRRFILGERSLVEL